MTSSYLDRLARSEPLTSWQPQELTEALDMLDEIAATHRRPADRARDLDIRSAIYRGRLQHELDQRIAERRSGLPPAVPPTDR